MKKCFQKTAVTALAAAFGVLLASCTGLERIAEGIKEKNLSGNGTFISSHLGLNENTKIPEIKTTFISGDMASVRSGTNAISYRQESSSSIWNAESITEKRFLSITLSEKEDTAKVIRSLEKIFTDFSGKK